MGSTRSQRPSRARRVALAAGAALVLAGTAGCSADTEWGRLGYPEPATEQGPLLLSFWQNAWIAAFAVGVLTWGLIFWAIIAYRKRANSGAPVQTRYNAPLEILYTVWWRVETTGIERVPGSGPTLVVANHSGVLPWDGPMINVALRHEHPARRHCRMLALDMFALLPFLAPLLARSGAIRANPENAIRILERGELVGVFPEGVKGVGKPFKNRYKLARFGRGGFVRIALKTGATIIPTAVVGAEEIHPNLAQANFIGRPFGLPYFPLTPTFPWLGLLGTIPFPTKWSIDFGEPLDLSRYPKDAADDPILVNRLSEQVRQQIQTIIDGRLARRRSIWFG